MLKPFLLAFAGGYTSLCQGDTLTLLNWDEYLSDKVIKQWEDQTGHTIEQIYFDNDEIRDSIIVEQKNKAIDLAILDETAAKRMGQQGFLNRIPSESELPNQQYIGAKWRTSCGEYGLPYLWGTLGVAYRKDVFSSPPDSWQVLLAPPAYLHGHIGLFEDYTDLLAPALFVRGESINTADKKALKSAFETIKSTLPHVLTFNYGVTYLSENPQADKLYIALAYSGDQYAMNEKAGKEVWEFTTLAEGTVNWVDCISILESSQKKSLATEFLNYINDPAIAAINSEDVYVATPIEKAKALQSAEFIADPSVYPPQSILNKSQQYEVLSEENTLLRNRITSSLVKLHDAQ